MSWMWHGHRHLEGQGEPEGHEVSQAAVPAGTLALASEVAEGAMVHSHTQDDNKLTCSSPIGSCPFLCSPPWLSSFCITRCSSTHSTDLYIRTVILKSLPKAISEDCIKASVVVPINHITCVFSGFHELSSHPLHLTNDIGDLACLQHELTYFSYTIELTPWNNVI